MAKVSPTVPVSKDPNKILRGTIEHPTYGRVTTWSKGGQIYRVQWSATDRGQNFHSRVWSPQRFARILDDLDLSTGG